MTETRSLMSATACFFVALHLVSGCTPRPEPTTVEPEAESAPTTAQSGTADSAEAEGTAQAPTPADEGSESAARAPEWSSIQLDALSEAQRELYDRAELARRMLGSDMMGRVMSVAAADGYPAAINVCAQEARGMAADVSSRLNVNIGRTSLRLRNTANSAPAWALPHIQANADSAASEATSYLATGPGGELGVLSPIMVGAACMNCHGSTEQLAPGVADALAQLYPADAATGFAEGDLRGWFWVEVEGTL